MRFTRSLTTLCSFTCLALFLSSSLVPQAHAGWGKGGKKNGETSSSPAATNSSPTISGSPATSAEEGNFYSFQPVAGDVDGDRLSFKIRNQPAWATFDTSTGRLSGTPDAADVGTYDNIQIGVTDGTVITALPVFSITVSGAIAVSGAAGQTGSVSLEWVAPTRRSDGSPISVSELAGYTVHYGPSQGNYTSSIGIDDPFATSVVVTDLPVGTYYFALTVDDINGQRSDYSGALLKRVQ